MKTKSQRAAEHGAAYLDAKKPNWWREIVVLDLDLSNPCMCVLGQLEGDFYKAIYVAGMNRQDAQDYGFSAPKGVRFDDLARAWKAIIRQRQKAAHAD